MSSLQSDETMNSMLYENNQGQSSCFAVDEKAISKQNRSLDGASSNNHSNKKRFNLSEDPAESSSSENTTFDFHLAISGLLAGVIFGFILAMQMSTSAASEQHVASSSSLYLHTMPQPSAPFKEFCQRPDDISSSVVDLSSWRSSSSACPQNETKTADFSESAAAPPGGGIAANAYYQVLLEEMEPPRYSIDGLIFSLYHTFLGY